MHISGFAGVPLAAHSLALPLRSHGRRDRQDLRKRSSSSCLVKGISGRGEGSSERGVGESHLRGGSEAGSRPERRHKVVQFVLESAAAPHGVAAVGTKRKPSKER